MILIHRLQDCVAFKKNCAEKRHVCVCACFSLFVDALLGWLDLYVLFILLVESKRMFSYVSVCGNAAAHRCCVMLFIHSIISRLPQHRGLNWGSLCWITAGCSVRSKLGNSHRYPPSPSPVIYSNQSMYQSMICKAIRWRGDGGFQSAEKVLATFS